jgi:hypothetical protein
LGGYIIGKRLLRVQYELFQLIDFKGWNKNILQGLRPHLTQWQARFRRWYDHEVSQHPELSPQEIQQRFQQYQELLKDLRTANKELLQLAQALALIAHG